ncbi:YTX2-like protein [Mya arenaria]|uniref:YTX2-like protein n=1 Tax=Mya arenaria TaxID=6604 RepID=A0ABY7E2L7_MYAAR|nr:YTX2-like protein [Mya arenaria]
MHGLRVDGRPGRQTFFPGVHRLDNRGEIQWHRISAGRYTKTQDITSLLKAYDVIPAQVAAISREEGSLSSLGIYEDDLVVKMMRTFGKVCDIRRERRNLNGFLVETGCLPHLVNLKCGQQALLSASSPPPLVSQMRDCPATATTDQRVVSGPSMRDANRWNEESSPENHQTATVAQEEEAAAEPVQDAVQEPVREPERSHDADKSESDMDEESVVRGAKRRQSDDEEDEDICCTPTIYSKEEILKTIKDMDPDKSPGSDGLMPISLLNTDRKVFSKITTTRMSVVLPSIISLSQTCSIRGRSILDNVHLSRNIVDYCNQKELSAAFINLDQKKVFDRVNWSFLFSTLDAFGFSHIFINMILNNFISDPFSLTRSVRQGCSLSPLLYVIVLEPFIRKIQNNSTIRGILAPGGDVEVKMTAYADDNTCVIIDDMSMVNFFKDVELYQKIFGQNKFTNSKELFISVRPETCHLKMLVIDLFGHLERMVLLNARLYTYISILVVYRYLI